jgi:hypothetical protein
MRAATSLQAPARMLCRQRRLASVNRVPEPLPCFALSTRKGSPSEATTTRPKGPPPEVGRPVAKMKARRPLTTVQGLKLGWACIVAHMEIAM